MCLPYRPATFQGVYYDPKFETWVCEECNQSSKTGVVKHLSTCFHHPVNGEDAAHVLRELGRRGGIPFSPQK